mmetsp:Transcript_22067/g.58785  ORF Transcript_22067/g.58785 Transcript_22067/m.58785 type:complete len:201 (+) Transcript_22067:1222-1824(+)
MALRCSSSFLISSSFSACKRSAFSCSALTLSSVLKTSARSSSRRSCSFLMISSSSSFFRRPSSLSFSSRTSDSSSWRLSSAIFSAWRSIHDGLALLPPPPPPRPSVAPSVAPSLASSSAFSLASMVAPPMAPSPGPKTPGSAASRADAVGFRGSYMDGGRPSRPFFWGVPFAGPVPAVRASETQRPSASRSHGSSKSPMK